MFAMSYELCPLLHNLDNGCYTDYMIKQKQNDCTFSSSLLIRSYYSFDFVSSSKTEKDEGVDIRIKAWAN